MAIFNGRYSAQIDGPFVVFLIGFRINRLWQFWKWMPVASAMGPMLRELATHPEKGLLAFQPMLTWRGWR
jgi:fumigallin biosynthesis monooxygenase-like protein